MASSIQPQRQRAASTDGQGKRRRRPATGRAKAYRESWGQTWGAFSRQTSMRLRTESEANE